jgi:hypothetical protein
MNFKQLFQYFILHSIVLTMLVFTAFYIYESGDMNVVVFGTILYMPYVFMLSGLNLILIGLGFLKITKRPLVFLLAFFTSIVLMIWLLLNGGQVTMRYWKLTLTEFLILNIVIIGINLLTIARLIDRKQREMI